MWCYASTVKVELVSVHVEEGYEKKKTSKKLCPVQELIWVHYPRAPCKDWLIIGLSLPITSLTIHTYHSNVQLNITHVGDPMGKMSILKMTCAPDNQIMTLSCLQIKNVRSGNHSSDG